MLRTGLVLAIVAALTAPAAAGAQWRVPASVTGDVAAVSRPQVAFAPRGDAVVAYARDGRLAWSWAPPGEDGPFASTTASSAPGGLLTYGAARVIAVSQTGGRLPSELRVRFGTVDGVLGPSRRPAPGEDVLRFVPAVDARGDAVVAYIQNVRRGPVVRRRVIRVLRRPAGGSFARPVTIAGRASPTAVGAAVGPRGELVVAYERDGRLEVRRRAPGHSWTAPQVLGPAAGGHTQIDVAAGGDGSFAVAWFAQELTEGGDNGPAAVRLALRSARGHAFHTARMLEHYVERAPDGAAVHVALAADGTGAVGWTGRQDGRFVARAADVRSDVGQTISDPAADAVLGGVAAGPGGAAVAVWAPPLDTASPRVFAAARPAGVQAFGGPETVGPPSREVATPVVAFDQRTGRALAAWVARTGQTTQAVLAAFRDPIG
jgi:hypothetical protein